MAPWAVLSPLSDFGLFGRPRAIRIPYAFNVTPRATHIQSCSCLLSSRLVNTEDLLDEYPDVRAWYEDGPSAAAFGRIESKIDKLSEVTEQLSAPSRGDDCQDPFHAEIDEARGFLEKHDYQMAKLLLQRIKVRSWAKLNARHKFRVFTNLAAVEISAANSKEAAELCLEAKTYQPDDEIAQDNEALGYFLLGQRKRAFELAEKLREEFPRAERVLGIFIRSASDSAALKSLEEAVPQELLEKDEVAAALTERARDSGEMQKAEKFIRAVTAANSRASGIWLLLGNIILQSEISGSHERYGTEALFYDMVRLREAEDAFGKALRLAQEERSTSEIVAALLNRRLTRIALRKEAEAREDLEEARQVTPQEPMVIEAYGESLGFERRVDEAIEVLRRLLPDALSPHGQMHLGMLLLERRGPGDSRSAGEVLSRVAKREERLPEDFREHCIELALQAFAKEEQFDACRELLEQVPGETVSAVGLETLTARLHLLEGKRDEASKGADEALALVPDTTTTFDIRRLALLLSALGHFHDALPLWQRVAVPNVLSADTTHLLDCAGRLNRHDIMLETYRQLRQAGVTDRTQLANELSLLEVYDTESAIKILNEAISRRPEDKALRLRRSKLGLALDRAELVDQDPSSVPAAEEVESRVAVVARVAVPPANSAFFGLAGDVLTVAERAGRSVRPAERFSVSPTGFLCGKLLKNLNQIHGLSPFNEEE